MKKIFESLFIALKLTLGIVVLTGIFTSICVLLTMVGLSVDAATLITVILIIASGVFLSNYYIN